MNGTVIFGVAMIIVALFTQGAWFLSMLIGGVVVAAFGAFSPTKPAAPPKLLADEDRFF